MRDLFLSSPWPGVAAWALIYISDFVLTIVCARLYHRRNVSSKIVFEGSFELNPLFERDVNSLKFISPRFLMMLVLSSTLIAVDWALTVPDYVKVYVFALGAFVCVELAVHVRHLTSLFLFSSRSYAEQLRGRIEYTRPLMLWMSSVQILCFAMLFAVLFIFTGSWFAAGGTFACSWLSAKNWRLARRTSARTAATDRTRTQEVRADLA
jgi:hypothetical protein